MPQSNFFDINSAQLYCELSNAIELDDFENFSNLLLTHREWFPFDYADNQLLHMACWQNRPHFVKFLLDNNNVIITLSKNPSILNQPIEENILDLLIAPFAERLAHQVYFMAAHLDSQEDRGYVSDFEDVARSPLLALSYENTTLKRKRDNEEYSIRKKPDDRFRPKKRIKFGDSNMEI